MSNTKQNYHTPMLGPNGIIVENWSSIEPRVDKVSYMWIIHRFSFYNRNGEDLRSPLFTAPTNDRCKWYLQVKFNSRPGENEKFIQLRLGLDPASECKQVFAKFHLFILDEKRNDPYEINSVKPYKFECGVKEDWGFLEFISKARLFSSREELLPNDTLTLYGEATFSEVKGFIDGSNRIQSSKFQPRVVNDLSEDLERLYKKQHFSDVVVSVKEKHFPAHKYILAARSSVFSAMFYHDTKENQNNHVVITDMDEKIVRGMLHYMYTGNFQNLDRMAEGLLVAADKYEMEGLKAKCEDTLLQKLTVENVLGYLVLADFHHAHKLKFKTISYIVAKSTEVMHTKAWDRFLPSNPHLVDEVCKALSRQLSF